MVTQYTLDEEHQGALDLVGVMFDRLPAGCKGQLMDEANEDPKAPWTGFKGVIQKIMQDVGVEEPDVLVSVLEDLPHGSPVGDATE